jgi:hypothetical protein
LHKAIAIKVALVVLLSIIAALAVDVPSNLNTAFDEANTINKLCIKNYQAGVSFTESYSDFEHLEKDTTVTSRNYISSDQFGANQSAIDAMVNSNVIGRASLSWQSLDPLADLKGRHSFYGSNAEALTGVFSINKLIQLWSNGTLGPGNIEWLPCI